MLSWQCLARVLAVLFALQISACSIYSVPGEESAPVEQQPDQTPQTPAPTVPQTAPRPAEPRARAAYQPLLAKAEEATARGDYQAALALLERAQRIDPDSAEVYLSLARAHSASGDKAQAQATAERGLLYCVSEAECDALRRYAR